MLAGMAVLTVGNESTQRFVRALRPTQSKFARKTHSDPVGCCSYNYSSVPEPNRERQDSTKFVDRLLAGSMIPIGLSTWVMVSHRSIAVRHRAARDQGPAPSSLLAQAKLARAEWTHLDGSSEQSPSCFASIAIVLTGSTRMYRMYRYKLTINTPSRIKDCKCSIVCVPTKSAAHIA